jgi:pyruvate,water dikinase
VTVLAERRGFAATAALLRLDEPGRQFLEQWDQFMLRHGHHVRGEADIHIPRWSETPDVVLDVLRGYVSADGAAPPAIEQRQHTRQQLLARCDCRARNPLSRALLRWLARRAQHGLVMRENLKSELVRVVALARQTVLELSRRLVASGVFRQIDDVFFLSQEELDDVVRGQPDVSALGRTIGERRGEYELYCSITPPPVVIGTFDPHRYAQQARRDHTPHQQPVAVILHGLCVSPGHVVGRARVILRADTTQQVLPGEILVAPFTDPGWTLHFVTAAGIVMDMGGLLSHGSIVAREYGIPAVVNVGPATTLIKTGQLLDVDANRGVVTLLESPAATSDISMNAGPADVSCRGG